MRSFARARLVKQARIVGRRLRPVRKLEIWNVARRVLDLRTGEVHCHPSCCCYGIEDRAMLGSTRQAPMISIRTTPGDVYMPKR